MNLSTSTSKTIVKATLAFVFNTSLNKVLLMRKQKPTFHTGLLNGLGGKLEKGESHLDCVVREIKEEAGILIPKEQWLHVGNLKWDIWEVSIWTTQLHTKSPTIFPEEHIDWYSCQPVPKDIVSNLSWLIPLSVDVIRQIQEKNSPPLTKITYK